MSQLTHMKLLDSASIRMKRADAFLPLPWFRTLRLWRVQTIWQSSSEGSRWRCWPQHQPDAYSLIAAEETKSPGRNCHHAAPRVFGSSSCFSMAVLQKSLLSLDPNILIAPRCRRARGILHHFCPSLRQNPGVHSRPRAHCKGENP